MAAIPPLMGVMLFVSNWWWVWRLAYARSAYRRRFYAERCIEWEIAWPSWWKWKFGWPNRWKTVPAGTFSGYILRTTIPAGYRAGKDTASWTALVPWTIKDLLTPWEEPLDVFYMFRANYAPKETSPMVYIVSHTWPDRWTTPGKKDGIVVYSNCDEVELFNDINGASLGKRKRNGIGTHFKWDGVDIKYNVLYA